MCHRQRTDLRLTQGLSRLLDSSGLLVVLLVASTVCIADETANQTPDLLRVRSNRPANEVAFEEILDRPFDSREASLSLNQLAGLIRRDPGINVVVDLNAVQELGIDPDEPLPHSLPQLPLEAVLKYQLKPLRLSWYFDDGVLFITTAEAQDSRLVRRVYYIRDLLRLIQVSEVRAAHSDIDQASASQPRFSRTGGFHPQHSPVEPALVLNQFQGSSSPADASATGELDGLYFHGPRPDWSAPRNPSSIVTDLIVTHVPEPWENTSGVGATLSVIRDHLVVQASYQQLRAVDGLLSAMLNAARSQTGLKELSTDSFTFSRKREQGLIDLLQPAITISYENTALQTVIEEFGNRHGISVIVDGDALEHEGLSLDVPITVAFQEIREQTALRMILDSVGMRLSVDHGAFVLTTNKQSAENARTVLYDVHDLDRAPVSDSDLAAELQNIVAGPWFDIDGMGGMISQPIPSMLVVTGSDSIHQQIHEVLTGMRQTLPSTEERVEGARIRRFYPMPDSSLAAEVLVSLPAFVEPGAWEGGEIQMLGKTLIIRQTPEIHDKVSSFLKGLLATSPSDDRHEP